MVRANRKTWKQGCIARTKELFATHDQCLIVSCDNVTSTQIHQIRKSLKGDATLLFGKKTLIKYVLKNMVEMEADFGQLHNHLKNNVGIVFVKNDIMLVRERLLANTRVAAAKLGSIAQRDVIIPPHNTGMPPDKIALFQQLNLPTKVVKGCLEMTTEKLVVRKGQKVGPNEATLMMALKMTPWVYALQVLKAFVDGCVVDDTLLDIGDKQFEESMIDVLTEITSFSLGAGYPTQNSVRHILTSCVRESVNVALAVDYDLPLARGLRDMLANPEAYAQVTAPVEVTEVASEVVDTAPAAAADEEEDDSDEFMDIFG